MTEFAAQNLRIDNQVYHPDTNEVSVTFGWDQGFSDSGNIILQQILYVSLFQGDYTCGEFARICQDVGIGSNSFTINGIGPDIVHYFMVGTLFNQGDLNNPLLTLYSSEEAFRSATGAPVTGTDHEATNLQVTSQTYNPINNSNTVHFIWDRALSDDPNHFIITQFLDITLTNPNGAPNWTCGDFGVLCIEKGPLTNGTDVSGIGFSTSHTWRINTLWDRSSSGLDPIWVESQYGGFLSAAAPPVTTSPASILPHMPTNGTRGILPQFPFPSSRIHILPYFPGAVFGPPGLPDGGGTPPSGPPGNPINGDGFAVARYALQFWDRSHAINMVAIAYAESSWNSSAAGDAWETFVQLGYFVSDAEKARSCFSTTGSIGSGHYWSWGLYQVNMNAHYDKLATWTGSNVPCDWAAWLRDPQNNTFAANVISSGGTYLVPWSTYNNGAYLNYIPQATTAVDYVLANG